MARSCLQSLPHNLTDVTRVLVRLDGSVRNDAASAGVSSLPTERSRVLGGLGPAAASRADISISNRRVRVDLI
jgi:hypothetical protein